MNLAALLLLGSVIERRSRALLLASVCVGMVGVDIWFLQTSTSRYYCGWSGVLNTLLLVALYCLYWPAAAQTPALRWRRRANNLVIVLIAAGALLKTLYEGQQGQALASQTLWPSAPGAHLAGWLAGLLVVLIIVLSARRNQPRRGA